MGRGGGFVWSCEGERDRNLMIDNCNEDYCKVQAHEFDTEREFFNQIA